MLEGLADSEDDAEKAKYAAFWKDFGVVLKEGVGEDHANAARIAKLLRFASTTSAGAQAVSLADYVGRAKETHGDKQKTIYYLTADSLDAAQASPHLEIFRRKGVEVLLLCDRVDEWMLSFVRDFDGTPLVSVAKGDLDLGELADTEEKATQERAAEASKDLVAAIKAALGDKVQDVRITLRLTDSPACVVVDRDAMSQHLTRLLKAAGQNAPEAKPILELNPEHALIRRLKPDHPRLADWAHLLLDQAQLAEGGTLDDPAGFVKRMNAMLLDGAAAITTSGSAAEADRPAAE
jgi:molecular chaperone HtpG